MYLSKFTLLIWKWGRGASRVCAEVSVSVHVRAYTNAYGRVCDSVCRGIIGGKSIRRSGWLATDVSGESGGVVWGL